MVPKFKGDARFSPISFFSWHRNSLNLFEEVLESPRTALEFRIQLIRVRTQITSLAVLQTRLRYRHQKCSLKLYWMIRFGDVTEFWIDSVTV